MRLFTGIDLPEEIVERMERLLVYLRPSAHLRWTTIANLHITTKFLGERPAGDLTQIKSALTGLPNRRSIPISIQGLGWFPNPHTPRILWAGVQGGSELSNLAKDTEAALAPLGVAVEDRAYSPHLTLARITQPAPLGPVRQAIASLASVEFGEFHAPRFYLYLSTSTASGSIYEKLAGYDLAG